MFDDAAILKQPRGRSRPSAYSDEIAAEICQDDAMPPVRTVRAWLAEGRGNFLPMYVRVREEQVEYYVDEMIDIADSVAGCTDSATVNAARLAIETRKWAAAKRLPRKYGDRVDIQQDGQLTVKILHGLGDDKE
jgi:Bacteriophage Sf6, terminase small subunit-like